MEEKNIEEKKDEMETTKEEVKQEEQQPKPKKKRKVWVIVLNIIAFCLLIFVAFETIIAFLNFSLIQKNEEPKYLVTKRIETKEDYQYTIYDMGLYRIVRKENDQRYEIKLLPFFLEM